MYGAVMVSQIGTRSDTNVVHINSYCSPEWFVLENNITIDEVHHRLKGRWGVGETEIHHCRFEEPISGFKGRFVFVSFTNVDVVVPPSYIELCIDVRVA